MASGITSRRESQKKRQERHKKLGLCIVCSRKAKEGCVRCEKCLEGRRRYSHRRREGLSPEYKRLIQESRR